jgi:hypothetical protein
VEDRPRGRYATPADFPRTIVARTRMYTYAVGVWDSSIQGFFVAPCQTLKSRFAALSSLYGVCACACSDGDAFLDNVKARLPTELASRLEAARRASLAAAGPELGLCMLHLATPYSPGGGTTAHSVLTSHNTPVPTTPYSPGGGTTAHSVLTSHNTPVPTTP